MTVALSVSNIHKSFGTLKVLKGITLKLNRGEVLGLMGENGAGKSTLVKVISGELIAEEGQVEIFGKALEPNPKLVAKLGVGVVHQHFMLSDDLTGLENIVLGIETSSTIIPWKKRTAEVLELQKKSSLFAPLHVKTRNLSVGDRQRIEILKVLYQESQIILFDEPTAVLTPNETVDFFKLIRTLAQQGYAIVIITHKLAEILEITDRVAVIRHGLIKLETETKSADENSLVRAMVGESVVLCKNDSTDFEQNEIVLKLDNAATTAKEEFGRSALSDCTFEIRAGEIFGMAGVDGGGQDLLAASLIGLTQFSRGNAIFNGSDLNTQKTDERVEKGMRWTPIDRYEQGIFSELALWENAVYGRKKQATKRIFGMRFLKKNLLVKVSQKILSACNVEPKVDLGSISHYSGGNQQKFSLGLLTDSADEIGYDENVKFILCCHPTRGVDVLSSQILRNRLVQCANKNIAVLLISSDLEELMTLCPRIGVLSGGKYMGTVSSKETGARELIGTYMAGHS